MKKRLLTLSVILLILLPLPAGTVYAGLESGVGAGSIIAGKNYKNYKYGSSSAYSLSIPVVYELNSWLGFESGISLCGRNYSVEKSIGDLRVIDLMKYNTFLTLPLRASFSYRADEYFSLFISLGGYCGYWIYGKEKGAVKGMNSITDVDSETDLSLKNRYEAGLAALFGCAVDLEKVRLRFFGQYDVDLTDMNRAQDNGGYPLHNSSLCVGCSVLWRFSR